MPFLTSLLAFLRPAAEPSVADVVAELPHSPALAGVFSEMYSLPPCYVTVRYAVLQHGQGKHKGGKPFCVLAAGRGDNPFVCEQPHGRGRRVAKDGFARADKPHEPVVLLTFSSLSNALELLARGEDSFALEEALRLFRGKRLLRESELYTDAARTAEQQGEEHAVVVLAHAGHAINAKLRAKELKEQETTSGCEYKGCHLYILESKQQLKKVFHAVHSTRNA